jgi:CheY-like chemotaxis protein
MQTATRCAFAPIPSKKAGPPPGTILIVDDNIIDRSLAGGLIEKQRGWKVIPAGNGQEALDLLQTERPDVILTDLVMDEMDGLALVENVRAKYPDVPVILMTAHGSEELALRALQAGAATYVPKKGLAKELLGCIDQVSAASKASQEKHRLQQHLARLATGYTLPNDPGLIRPVIAEVQADLQRLKLLERARVRLGLALESALKFALYHGNLEISLENIRLGGSGLQRLAAGRAGIAPYRDRQIRFTADLSRSEARFVIGMDGPGLDLSLLANPADPANLANPHSRDMVLIQTFMDEVAYDAPRKEISLVKHGEATRKEQP